VIWAGRDFIGKAIGSGLYIYRIVTGNQIQTKQMLHIK